MTQKPFIIRHGLNTGSTEIINSVGYVVLII